MQWIVYAVLSSITAAFVAFFSKLALGHAHAVLFTAVRSIIMALFLLGMAAMKNQLMWPVLLNVSGRDWLFIVLASGAGALSWLFYFYALTEGPVLMVTMIDRLSIVVVALLAVMFLGQPLSWSLGAGIILVSIGMMLLTVGS